MSSATEEAQLLSLTGTSRSWLGGSDREFEGVWRWQLDAGGDTSPSTWMNGLFYLNATQFAMSQEFFGQELLRGTYTNFRVGEPSSGVDENCLQLFPLSDGGGGWNDRSCSTSLPFTCQLPSSAPPPPPPRIEFVLSSILSQSAPGDLLTQGSDARDAVLVACELTGASVGLGDAYVMADTRNGSATAQEARYWCAKAGSVRVKAVAFTVTSDDGQLRARATRAHYLPHGGSAVASAESIAAWIGARLNAESLMNQDLAATAGADGYAIVNLRGWTAPWPPSPPPSSPCQAYDQIKTDGNNGQCATTGGADSGNMCGDNGEFPDAAACQGAHSNGYLEYGCGHSCAQARCNADDRCTGYSYRTSVNALRRVKLKSQYPHGVSGGGSHKCFRKNLDGCARPPPLLPSRSTPLPLLPPPASATPPMTPPSTPPSTPPPTAESVEVSFKIELDDGLGSLDQVQLRVALASTLGVNATQLELSVEANSGESGVFAVTASTTFASGGAVDGRNAISEALKERAAQLEQRNATALSAELGVEVVANSVAVRIVYVYIYAPSSPPSPPSRPPKPPPSPPSPPLPPPASPLDPHALLRVALLSALGATLGVCCCCCVCLALLWQLWTRREAARLNLGGASRMLQPPTARWRCAPQRDYACFLSHFKGEAGSDARYLHDLLQRMLGAKVRCDGGRGHRGVWGTGSGARVPSASSPPHRHRSSSTRSI